MKTWREVLREVYSYAPRMGFISRRPLPFGITAVVRAKDEEDWIDVSIRSLIGFADQILIGDNGSEDGTPAILRQLKTEFPRLIDLSFHPDEEITTMTNALLSQARYRWIIRWDADLVAHTEGPHRITLLREYLRQLPERRFFVVYLRMVELAGDLWHQRPAYSTRQDVHAWTSAPEVRQVYDGGGSESPRFPRWYAVRYWNHPCFFHLHIKSDMRLFHNYIWYHRLREPPEKRKSSFGEYARYICRRDYGHDDMERAARDWTNQQVKELIPYDASAYQDHPSILGPHLRNPRYRITYDHGEISGRERREG